MLNLDNLFKEEAFKNIDKEQLEMFKKFIKSIEGKNINECFLEIVDFFNSIPKSKELSPDEKLAITKCIMSCLNKNEQEKFLSMLEIIENFS